jgi:hypothetical protein
VIFSLAMKKKFTIGRSTQEFSFLYFFVVSMTNLIPLEDHILVEAVQEDAMTKSGIILPDSNKEKPSK